MFFLLLTLQVQGQVNPRFFPKQVNPDSSNFEFYSQKNGINYRANAWDLKRYFTPKYPGAVAYVPAPTGNVLNRTEFVKGADGVIYYIDATGKSVKFDGGVTPNALSDSIAYVLELVSEWDTSATNELQVIYIVNHRLYISGSTDPGLNLAPYRDSIYISNGGGRDTLKTSTGYKVLLPLADGSETKLNVAGLLAVSGNGTTGTPYSISTPGGTLSGTGGNGFVGFPVQSSNPGTPGGGFRFYADALGRPSWVRNDGFVRTFDASTITANRVYMLPDVTGTLAMLEAGQTFTGVQVFAPTGSGGSGFTVQSTGRFSIPAPVMTDAQAAAITGQTAGASVYSTTQQRPYVHNGTAFQGVVLGPQSGFAAGQISHGGTGGNLTSSNNLRWNETLGRLSVGGAEVANYNFLVYSKLYPSNYIGIAPDPSNAAIYAKGDRLHIGSSNTPTTITLFSGFMGVGIGTPESTVDISPVYSATADLSGGGYGFRLRSVTYNSTSSNGSVIASAALASFDGGIISSTNPNTFTNISTVRIAGAPTAGANATVTNAYALWVDSGNSLFNGNLIVSGTSTLNGAVTATSNNHRFGFLQLLTSGNPTVTGQGIVITGVDREFQFKGTGDSGQPQTFSFGISSGTTDMKSLENSHPVNGFIRVYGGFRNPNANYTVGALLNLTPQYDVGTLAGAKITGVYYNPTLTAMSGVLSHNAWESTSGDVIINSGRIAVGASTPNASALLDLTSTNLGLLIPRATTAQINAVSPALALQMFSTTDERIHIKRSSGFYQIAYIQDIKRDTAYRTVNSNLNLSALTAYWKANFKYVKIETVVTALASGDNTITLPTPSEDLFGIKFEVVVEDTSGDSDISQLIFGTDGSGDGYSYNGDGTFISTFNLYAGVGVYLSVAKCEAKGGAYRWVLQ